MNCEQLSNYIYHNYSLDLYISLINYNKSTDNSYKKGINDTIKIVTGKSIDILNIDALKWDGKKKETNEITQLKQKNLELTCINNELRENYWTLKQSIIKSKKKILV